MKIIKEAIAGTLESSDLLVKVAPSDKGTRDIVIKSEVIKQFGKQIKRVVTDTLDKLSVSDGVDRDRRQGRAGLRHSGAGAGRGVARLRL